jgi:hypothetical protein
MDPYRPGWQRPGVIFWLLELYCLERSATL